ncbi:hypothetical protein JZU54_01425 [bacterium]|nr:hypothetical protein [bacterium]
MSISKVEPAVFTGFDRIVFKGCIRQLAYADGAARFLAGRGVLNKDYKAWMAGQSSALVAAVTDPTLASLGGITNKALQKRLAGTEWAKGMTGRRLSADRQATPPPPGSRGHQ